VGQLACNQAEELLNAGTAILTADGDLRVPDKRDKR
jgi:hypothetical protein